MIWKSDIRFLSALRFRICKARVRKFRKRCNAPIAVPAGYGHITRSVAQLISVPEDQLLRILDALVVYGVLEASGMDSIFTSYRQELFRTARIQDFLA